MTPPSRSSDQRVAGYRPRGANGAAGPAGLDNGLAGGPAGIGVGGGAAGFGVAGGPAGTGTGVVGSARVGSAGNRPGIGNGLGSDGVGATGLMSVPLTLQAVVATSTAPMTGNARRITAGPPRRALC